MNAEPRPRVAVVGAGAVGCYYGGMLARAGARVTLIGRPVHVEAVRRDGLVLERQGAREHVPVDASTDVAAAAGATLVLVCVKSGDTEEVARALAPHLSRDPTVVSLQNGVDNAARMRPLLAATVLACVVYVGCEMAGPGHVRHMGRGELVIGGRAGIEADARAAEATARTFERAGVRLDAEGLLARVMKVGESMPGQISSTAQDIGLGKPTEIDALNGHVVRRGAALGVPTPVNRTLYALVKLLEIAKWTPRHAAPRGGRVLRTLSPPRAAPCIRPTSRRA